MNLKMSMLKKNLNMLIRTQKMHVDVCTILEKCSIEEISKYLLNMGKREKLS